MSKGLYGRVNNLAKRLHGVSSGKALENVELAHKELRHLSEGRCSHFKAIDETSFRSLAASLNLDCWADDAIDGTRVLSITGKIIVVDVTFTIETGAVVACTLVLASEDGMQEEVTADGRDTMYHNLISNRPHLFAQNLERLAFLDHHSDPGTGLDLFKVQDILREALQKKEVSSVAATSHLSLAIPYHRESIIPDLQTQFVGIVRIVERDLGSTRQAKLDGGQHGLLCPVTWLDANGNWIGMKNLTDVRTAPGLCYTLDLEPPIPMPKYLVDSLLEQNHQINAARSSLTSKRSRKVMTPSGPIHVNVDIDAEPVSLVKSISFEHPKQITLIQSLCKQAAMMKYFIDALGSNDLEADLELQLEIKFIEDDASLIDGRKSIVLELIKDDLSLAQVTISPDSGTKCWHHSNSTLFERYFTTTHDLLVSYLALEGKNEESSDDPVMTNGSNHHHTIEQDFRYDSSNAILKRLSTSEVKNGVNYEIPVDVNLETKSGFPANAKSPNYLSALGTFLRAASLDD